MRRDLALVWAFLRKDFRVAWSYRLTFVTSIGVTFYGLVIFHFVAKLVGSSQSVGGPDEYFRFVVVGLALSGVLRASAVAAAANARRDQIEGTLEILATQPIRPVVLGLGWSAWPLLEAVVDGVITLIVAVPLGFAHVSPDFLSATLVLVLSALVFVGLGFLGAASVLVIQQAGQATGILVAGLTLISGAIFPVSVLPGWLQTLSALSPLTYALRALRAAVIGGAGPVRIGSELLTLAGFAVVLLPLGGLALSLAIAVARRRGTLHRF